MADLSFVFIHYTVARMLVQKKPSPPAGSRVGMFANPLSLREGGVPEFGASV
jgi:hypothetical protein